MSLFAASPFLKALGWALLHSLWQFAICWLIFRTITAGIKKITAHTRHSIAVLLLFAGALSFIAGFSWKYYAAGAVSHSSGIVTNTSYYTLWHSADASIDALMPYWSLLYLACVAFLLIKFCLFVRRAGNLQHNGVTKMSALWRAYVKNISAQLGIKKEVKALLSLHIDTPQVIGFLKPVILLPAACLVNLSTEQLEAVLLHELVHIKRNDYLINLFVASVEIVFFFNPFVKQMTAGIRKEREYSCDDMVIQFQYHPHNYAAALLTLEKNRLLPVTYGIAASGKNQQQLLTRVERILGMPNKQTTSYRLGACLMALLLLGFMATINPAKVAVDNFGQINLALAFNDDNFTAEPGNDEKTSHISNEGSPVNGTQKNDKIKNEPAGTAPAIKADELFNNAARYAEPAITADNDEDEDQVQAATHKERIDFSLPQKEAPVVPDADPTEASVPEPYVPANSFSFQLMQDTAMPKIKGETYNERMAKEAALKVQKAMEQINWQKIEKQLKYSQRGLTKLKNEIVLQIQQLDWQKINNEVKTLSGHVQLEKLQNMVKQDEAAKAAYQQYQQTEAYREAINRRLAEQQDLIKDNEQRTQDALREAEKQQKKLQADMKKRRIIYI